ncbi:MAG: rod shape-determining protein RodA [Terrimicrobiaceae bacterium]
MHSWLKKLFGMNWVLLLLTFGLLAFGIYAIYSATWMREESFWTSQIVWAAIATPVFLAVALTDYRWIRFGAWPLYALGVMALVTVMLIGEKRYGARSWLDLGVMSFQPSQLAIIAGIMTLAVFLELTKHWPDVARIALAGVITAIPWVLILIEPDLGSCIVWVPVLLAMLFLGGVGKRWLVAMILLGVALIPLVVYFGLREYQFRRITTFLNPNLDPQGDGWNINQSLLAIGSGGFSGKGFKAPNTLNELGFLPKTIVHNDFIFSVLGEQHGFIGGVALLAALLLLMLTGLYIAMNARDDLGRLVACGIVMLLFTHTFMNIGMTISVTPITGLPLPLISYGGSFLLITMISLGLLQSIWIHRKPKAG